MSEDALDSLVEQRIAQLAEISEKRNALLREMYRIMRKRTNIGATVSIDDEEEDDLHVFLKNHNLQENPDTGFISHLSENELFDLVSPEEYTFPRLGSHPSRYTSPELADGAHRSKSRSSGRSFMESTRTTPVLSAPGASAEHSDSEDELDVIRSSSSPATLTSGAIPILGPTESHQSIPVGSPIDSSAAATLPEDRASLDMIFPSATIIGDMDPEPSIASKSSELSTERSGGMTDVMDVDTSNDKLPLSFSLPLAPEVLDWSNAHNLLLSNQPEIDATSLDMDIDVESSRIVDARDKAEILPVAQPTPFPREATFSRSTLPPHSLSLSRLSSSRNTSTPEQLKSINVSLPSSSPVFIPIPPTSFHSVFNDFDFSTMSLDPPPVPPVSPTQPRHQLDFRYTLPLLDTLPTDFKTKNKKIKQKKKDKERDKGDGKKDKEVKDDWVPWGLTRWNATIRTNPVYKRVAKATKCLNTRDWAVAMTELKVIRAVDRIELLKSGRWSFRQPRKQRTSGGITKTHWDYLMDEMKWMRTDFREERKWKMALAYNLSTAVLEWHAAGTQEKRLKRGICVHWKPPRQDVKDHTMEDVVDLSANPLAEIETPTPSGSTRPSSALLNLDYGSDDEDDEDQEKDVDDGLDTSAMVEESLADMNHGSYGESLGFKDLQPKTEEIDDNSVLQSESMDVDHLAPSENEATTRSTIDFKLEGITTGLKSTSGDPMLLSMSMSMSASTSFSSERSSIPQSKSSKINLYAPLRERIAHSEVEKLFLDFDDFRITTTDPSSENMIESLLPPSDLSDVFPEFQPYAMFGLAASTPPPVDGKKKSEKKSDRDDPVNKRVDEVAYSKLYPASTFMFSKPTLVGAMQPSKHLREGRWVDLDQSPISIEYEAPQPFRLPEEFGHGIFEHKLGPFTISTPAVQSVPPTPGNSSSTAKFKEPLKRAMEHLWSASDDLLLKSLAERYPNNWALVSECYNTSRVTIRSDWRTSKDCQERWRERWSPAATQRLLEAESTPLEGTPPPGTPLTNMGGSRGVKRLASGSISSSTAPTISTGSGSEPKKRRRHAMVQDAVRRSIKKRNETAQKNNIRKSATMHESHNDFSNLAKMSPAEISRRKVERDQELQPVRPRVLTGPNGAGARASNGQQPTVGQPGGANGAQRASVSGVSAPSVAQIRSQQVPISQQQRAGTPLVAGNSRMSPQQQMLAQQVQRAQSALQGGPTQAVTQAQAQAQVQAQLALSHALAQAQAAQAAQGHSTIDAQTAAALRGNLQQALAQNGVNGNTQLSPPYTSRDATSSPAHASPPRSTGTPSNGTVNSPRPPSAQAQTHPLGQTQLQGSTQSQVGILQNGQIGALNIPQARNIQGHYYLPNVSASYTPEQLQQSILRMQQAQQLQQSTQSQPLQSMGSFGHDGD
ncbi:hypothetical protein F5050DRAFT_1723920 [Lentinula boryana]|uniref:Vacuolar import and degradation protein 21 n=1 Tax=Lentinula boryana TaxID=40481 RepID=A0ABQ8QSJ3_9AGAR|nr:hypothetical protein F5050DRAFT_1723920 [Lentinula boryana]